ncbi:MAG: Lrp/AsnC family transcriptional regulator [Candidatus Bathyarchaeota archaeon]|nr:MAG: Lrp/AsnC family transcriptional regulator [Candidatus Bathyarchaeum tardum]WNZ29795.1 MAG: Lrp/AsnC family transcriptional regulator [Candidatus Bathyarchaeota archaeon]
MDETDLKIAQILTNNARMPFSQIAEELGISTKKVINRYKKMKDMLPHSTISLNLEKLGYIGQAIFRIKISYKHNLDEIFKKICNTQNVIVALKHYGPFELTAIVPFKDLDHLSQTHDELSKIEGIKEFHIQIKKAYNSWPLNMYSSLLTLKK